MTSSASPAFTILLPIVRPPAMLPFAVRSVLAQDRRDFELFIVCDGAPPETVACAEAFAAEDPRIRVFAHPKGDGHGEAYRHQALQQARGTYVCQIGDDDLWLPHHLTEMATLLEAVDFGHIAHFEIAADGTEGLLAGDLSDPWIREHLVASGINFFGASVSGYRLAAYRALPEGWAPSPPDRPSDLNMWLKFLAAPGLRFGTRVAVTTLKLGAGGRRDWSLERRAQEVEGWAARLADPAEREQLIQRGLLSMSRVSYHLLYRGQEAQQRADARAEQLVRAAEGEKHRADALAEQLARAIEAQNQAIDARNRATEAHGRAAAERDALAVRLNDAVAGTEALKTQLTARENQVLVWRTRSQDMRQRWSWRLTRPFRKLARLIAGKPRR